MLSRIIVLAQFLSAAILFLSAKPNSIGVVGACILFSGFALGLWSVKVIGWRRLSIAPDVNEKTRLVTAGPYRVIRHPMYAALLVVCAGLVFAPLAWWKPMVWLLLFSVLVAKSALEERHLCERFAEYADYTRRTWRFVPYLW